MESMDEWRKLVKEKYDNLEKVVNDNLPSLWLGIEFVLSIKSIMNIAGVTLPWFGIILGRASSLKTAAIEMLRDTINTFYTDIFTPKAFVSNSTAATEDKLREIDMLLKSRTNCSSFRNYLQCSTPDSSLSESTSYTVGTRAASRRERIGLLSFAPIMLPAAVVSVQASASGALVGPRGDKSAVRSANEKAFVHKNLKNNTARRSVHLP